MCMPKAPKEDPQVKEMQKQKMEQEQEKLRAEKKEQLLVVKRRLRGATYGYRSLFSSNPSGDFSGFGRNY